MELSFCLLMLGTTELDGAIRSTCVLVGVLVARAIVGGVEIGDGVATAAELSIPFLGANRLEQDPMIRNRTIKDKQPPQPPPWPPFVFTFRF